MRSRLGSNSGNPRPVATLLACCALAWLQASAGPSPAAQDAGQAPADDVLLQFGYLTDELSTSDRLLKDFHLDKVAETIRRDCRAVAKGSALASYLDLQSACGNPIDATATRECFTKLSDLAKLKERDYEEVRSRLEGMRYDLEELATLEDEASRAKQILDEIELPEVESGKCLKNFGQNAVPAIQEFIGIDQELDACKLAAAGAGPAGGAREVVVGQSLQQLQGKQDAGFEKLDRQAPPTLDIGRRTGIALRRHPEPPGPRPGRRRLTRPNPAPRRARARVLARRPGSARPVSSPRLASPGMPSSG